MPSNEVYLMKIFSKSVCFNSFWFWSFKINCGPVQILSYKRWIFPPNLSLEYDGIIFVRLVLFCQIHVGHLKVPKPALAVLSCEKDSFQSTALNEKVLSSEIDWRGRTSLWLNCVVTCIDKTLDFRADKLSHSIPLEMSLYLLKEHEYGPLSAAVSNLNKIGSVMRSTKGYSSFVVSLFSREN